MRWCEFLVANHEDVAIDESPIERAARLRVHRPGRIDVADLRSGVLCRRAIHPWAAQANRDPCLAPPNSRRWRSRTPATGTARGYRREAPSQHPGVGSGRPHRQPHQRRFSGAAARCRRLQLRGRRRRLFRGRIHIERRVAGVDDRVAAKAERAAPRRRLSPHGCARDLRDQPVLACCPGLCHRRGSVRCLAGLAAPRGGGRPCRGRTGWTVACPLLGHPLETEQAIDAFIDSRLPFSVRGTFGGNTSCVEIITGSDEYVICDLGTGVREFGNRVLREHGPGRKHCFNIFLSHPHWDHIMGFPFFAPSYIPGNRIHIYGCHDVLSEALHTQHSAPWFPVDFRELGSTIEFVTLEPGRTYEIAGLSVTSIRQFHTGQSYGYRFSRGGKSIVYSTDCEHKYSSLDESYPFVAFYRNADVLIFDAMYSLADTISVKEDWGHSSNVVAVELAQAAQVGRL